MSVPEGEELNASEDRGRSFFEEWALREKWRLERILLKVKELAVVDPMDSQEDLKNRLLDIAAEVDGVE